VAKARSPRVSLVEFHSMPTTIRHSKLVPRKRSSTLVDQSIDAIGLTYGAMHGLTQLDLNIQGWPDPCKSDVQASPSIIETANHVSSARLLESIHKSRGQIQNPAVGLLALLETANVLDE
jgi:hypothetical protein